MAEEFSKELAEFDKIEDQYLSQIFADDEEIKRTEALAVEKSIAAVDKCKTKEEFETLVGED